MSHIFISYVKENIKIVMRLCNILSQNNCLIWFDRDNLEPGTFWKDEIRNAIKTGGYFIPCYTEEYFNKDESYAHKELSIAIDFLQIKNPSKKWFVPVKLGPCNIPDIEIGGGKTLNDIQFIDLSKEFNKNITKLIKLVKTDNKNEILSINKDIDKYISNYFLYHFNHTNTIKRWGFDIFTLPIILKPEKINFEGINTVIKRFPKSTIIFGKPATGKTTGIHRILGTAIKQTNINSAFIPFQIDKEFINDFEKIKISVCDNIGIELSHFESLFNYGRFIFIFDGLNEYRTVEDIELLSNQLLNLSKKLGNNYFIATCRTYEYNRIVKKILDDFTAFEISDLTYEEQEFYINLKFEDSRIKNKVAYAFSENLKLREICSNQFLFLMALNIIPKQDEPLKLSSQLYSLFLKEYVKKWPQFNRILSNEEIIKILEKIAYNIAFLPKESLIKIEKTIIIKILKENKIQKADLVLEELLRNGLLVEVNQDEVMFIHQTFQEFLFASWLIRNKIFPSSFSQKDGIIFYESVIMNDIIKKFYLELSGFDKLDL